MVTQTQPRYTFTDYLSAERQENHIRHEYVDGQVFDMVGASFDHNTIVANLSSELLIQMKDRPCHVLTNDMKVLIATVDACKYPDVIALCGEPEFFDDRRDVLLNPTLVVEVLSPSTEAYDRGEKFALYRRLPSLHEYLLVSQDRYRLELYVRQADNNWLLTEFSKFEDEVALQSIDCRISLKNVYDKVVLKRPAIES